jgi:hypothetical protein
MAVLTDEDRRAIWAKWMQVNLEACGIEKGDLRAAFNAADDWVDTNRVSFNSAIPEPARSSLTAAQKARILSLVVEARFKAGS